MPRPPPTATVSRSKSSADAPPSPWQALSVVGLRLHLNSTPLHPTTPQVQVAYTPLVPRHCTQQHRNCKWPTHLSCHATAPNITATASGLHTSRATHDVVLSTVDRRLLVEVVRVVCTELAWSRSVTVGASGRMKFSAVFGSRQVSELAVSFLDHMLNVVHVCMAPSLVDMQK
jgi:hypothetical protein